MKTKGLLSVSVLEPRKSSDRGNNPDRRQKLLDRISLYNKSRTQEPEADPSTTKKSPSKCGYQSQLTSPIEKDLPSTNHQEDIVPDPSPKRASTTNEAKLRFRKALANYERNRRESQVQAHPGKPLTGEIVHRKLLNKIKEYDKKRRQAIEENSPESKTEVAPLDSEIPVTIETDNEPDKVIVVEMEIVPTPPDPPKISILNTTQNNPLLERIAAYQRNFKCKNPESNVHPVDPVAENLPRSLQDRIASYHVKLRESSSVSEEIFLVHPSVKEVNITQQDKPAVDRQSLLRDMVSKYEKNRKSYTGQSINESQLNTDEVFQDNQESVDDFILIEGPDGGYVVNPRDMMSYSVPVRIFE